MSCWLRPLQQSLLFWVRIMHIGFGAGAINITCIYWCSIYSVEYADNKPLKLNLCTQSYCCFSLYTIHQSLFLWMRLMHIGFGAGTINITCIYYCSIYIMKCSGNRPLPLNLGTQSYQSFPLYTTLSPRSMHTCLNALTDAPATPHLLIHCSTASRNVNTHMLNSYQP